MAGLFPISAHSLVERHGEVMEKPWGNVEDFKSETGLLRFRWS
jgi:hypothetical protein